MKKNEQQTPAKINTAVQVSDLCSAEHYKVDNKLKRVLTDITFSVKSGEVCGISAKNPYEASLMTEIVANLRPYYSGKCVLVEQGMMRRKRIILPHLFYIDTPGMLYDNLNVLEFLMFATGNSGIEAVERQSQIFETLNNIGLGYISLSQIKVLTEQERLIIELLTAAYSASVLVVFNVVQYEFSDELIRVIREIGGYIKSKGKALVIGTAQSKLIGVCCDTVVYILDGVLRYFGTVDDLYNSCDKVLYVITDHQPQSLAKKLKGILPQYSYEADGSNIYVYNYSHEPRDNRLFYETLAQNGVFPDHIKINTGRVQNSFEELIRQHDLQDKLL